MLRDAPRTCEPLGTCSLHVSLHVLPPAEHSHGDGRTVTSRDQGLLSDQTGVLHDQQQRLYRHIGVS